MKLSYRISVKKFQTEEEFNQLIMFLDEYRNIIDEIALFTEYWHHGYYPLDRFLQFIPTLKDRIGRLKDRGFPRVGINMLDTIGQCDEAWDWLPQLPYQPMVDYTGDISRSCFCPNGDEFRQYIVEKYKMIVAAEPDFIWIDDDMARMHGHSVSFPCFCQKCLAVFNERNNTDLNREQLVAQLQNEEGGFYREKWIEHNISSIEGLLGHIEKAVHRVSPHVELGLMTGPMEWSTYSGSAFERWLRALKSTRIRPGGGFYNDSVPNGLVHKALGTQRQVSLLPQHINDIQYELENFPSQEMGKSVKMTILECTSNFANGVNGIAFNALKSEEGSLDGYHGLMRGIRDIKACWDKMDSFGGTFKNVGFYPALSPLLDAKRSVMYKKWFTFSGEEYNVTDCYVLNEIGIPFTMYPDAACGTILTGRLAEAYSEEELKSMLSKGVFLDAEALKVVWEKGLGEFCGVSVDKTYDNGVLEEFTGDVINGCYHRDRRDCRLSFSKGKAYTLNLLSQEVRTVTNLVSYTEDYLGPTLALYENSLGGRIAVSGYAPWQNICSYAKRYQIVSIFDWLSNGKMPVRIDKCLKVVPFIKTSNSGKKFMVMLLNASFDSTGSFEVSLRYAQNDIKCIDKNGDTVSITDCAILSKCENETRLKVNNIMPWDFIIIMVY